MSRVPEVNTSELLRDAVERGGAVAAFNVITLEQAEGIVAGAERADRPIVLQLSENAVRFHFGRIGPMAAALHGLAAAASVSVALHLDHVESEDIQQQAAPAGLTSVMIDAGRLPYGENVDYTAAAARTLHRQGIFVEAELGFVGGKNTQVTSAHERGVRTDPAQAAEFVAATGVDALAVAVGSSHAMTSQTATLDLALIEAIATVVGVPLVLHGSSGVPDDLLRAACRAGIRKVNVGTAVGMAFTRALRSSLAQSNKVDPRPHLAAARDGVAAKVEHVLSVLSG